MGLLMFREPEATETKPAVKTDLSAPARSAIRRQRTVRYNPHVRNHRSSSRNRALGQSGDAERRLLGELTRRDGNLGYHDMHALRRLMRASGSTREDLEREAQEFYDDIGELTVTAASEEQEGRSETRLTLPRSALPHEPPATRLRPHSDSDYGTLVRESPFPMDVEAPSPPAQDAREDVRRAEHLWAFPDVLMHGDSLPPPPPFMPTPPYTSDSPPSRSPPHSSLRPSATASLTPRFAPAHRFDSPSGEPLLRPSSSHPSTAFPTGRYRSSRTSNPTASSGLGDRPRSFSPSSNSTSHSPSHEDTWETLLTTIAPDTRLPSASSSFTSTAASSFSSSNPSRSTTATSAFTGGPNLQLPPICDPTDPTDSDLSSGADDDDDDDNDDEDEQDLELSEEQLALAEERIFRQAPSRPSPDELERARHIRNSDAMRGLISASEREFLDRPLRWADRNSRLDAVLARMERYEQAREAREGRERRERELLAVWAGRWDHRATHEHERRGSGAGGRERERERERERL